MAQPARCIPLRPDTTLHFSQSLTRNFRVVEAAEMDQIGEYCTIFLGNEIYVAQTSISRPSLQTCVRRRNMSTFFEKFTRPQQDALNRTYLENSK